VTAIAKTVARGPDGSNVLCFRHRAAYLAEYLADRASGTAGDRWYFGAFESLDSLSPSAAIRGALLRDTGLIERVLLELGIRDRLEPVLGVLGDHDALRIYGAMQQSTGADPTTLSRDAIEVVVSVWRRSVAGDASHGHTGLRLHVAARQAVPALDPRATAAAVETVLECATRLRDASPERERDLLSRMAVGEEDRTTRSSTGRGDSDALLPLAALATGDPGWLASIARELRTGGTHRSDGSTHIFISPYGGVFVLLASLVQHAPEFAELLANCSPEVRAYLLIKTVGARRALAAAMDPALTLAAGLGDRLALDRLRAAIQTDASNQLTELLHQLPGETLQDDARRAADLDFFTLPDGALPFVVPPGVDATASDIARALYAFFRLRLVGFARSSVAYLFDNMLSGMSSIEVAPDDVHVRLPVTPLDVVLQLTTIHGQQFSVPWLPGVTITLSLADG
jgi:hypothetical protein